MWSKTFTDVGDFAAFDACKRLLKDAGFSIGQMQGPAPIGVMFGECEISKWRNMTPKEQRAMHGTIAGDKRNGPVVLLINNAPLDAIKALARAALPPLTKAA
jgi:hypothetical protein